MAATRWACRSCSRPPSPIPSNLTYKLDVTSRHAEAIQKLMTMGDKARATGDLDTAAACYQRVLTIESTQSRASKALEGVEADRRHAQTLRLGPTGSQGG